LDVFSIRLFKLARFVEENFCKQGFVKIDVSLLSIRIILKIGLYSLICELYFLARDLKILFVEKNFEMIYGDEMLRQDFVFKRMKIDSCKD
jgi:hypothetical protein